MEKAMKGMIWIVLETIQRKMRQVEILISEFKNTTQQKTKKETRFRIRRWNSNTTGEFFSNIYYIVKLRYYRKTPMEIK